MINYFQAIQTALLYKKKLVEMFRSNFNIFLDLQRYCGENKNQSLKKPDVVSDFYKSGKFWLSEVLKTLTKLKLLVALKQNIFKTSDSQN